MLKRTDIPTWPIVFLILALVVASSPANEKHPLHGSWISQSKLAGELQLTFHPDGTFHMRLTASIRAANAMTWCFQVDGRAKLSRRFDPSCGLRPGVPASETLACTSYDTRFVPTV